MMSPQTERLFSIGLQAILHRGNQSPIERACGKDGRSGKA
jgi:hypothetical protein